jgi:hypothetical protein
MIISCESAATSNVRRTFLCAARCAHFAVRRTVHCAHSMLTSNRICDKKTILIRCDVNLRLSQNCSMHGRSSPFLALLDIIQSSSIRSQHASDEDVHISNYIRELSFLLNLPTPPRMSGFFKMKISTTFSPIRAWKERWLVMTQDEDKKIILVFRNRKEYDENLTERFLVHPQHCVVERQLKASRKFCFSFSTVDGRRIILSATSEFQMWSWISCIQPI